VAVPGGTLVKARGCEGQGAFVIFVFSDCELDLDRFELRRAGQLRPVEPQVFDLLAVLIRERHRDDGRSQRLIRTAHGRGYQFAAPVDEAAQPDPVASLSPTPPAQEIRLTPAGDGIRLAYAISGAGPRLVKAANWLSHLAYDWESPVWRHWLAELSSRFRLVRYDERGCGLSDWDIGRFSFDDWVDDLEAVADAAGLDRFPQGWRKSARTPDELALADARLRTRGFRARREGRQCR
jgi:DNA-binding winged helix-turn-helix (wHTH) protein